ncbi:hypothetical protein MAR_028850 [Mya arenaria]|uniref:Uncharacterized protein n=1 Tax=Mya arenaria TaxID=6604 RepID=A0ABY7DIJ3_MYAAR|nr:hypothetical protein MAR_028850 [Mya arenaria]
MATKGVSFCEADSTTSVFEEILILHINVRLSSTEETDLKERMSEMEALLNRLVTGQGEILKQMQVEDQQ